MTDFAELRLLIVSDSFIARRIMRILLSDSGYETVAEVTDGATALLRLETGEEYDLVIAEIDIPHLDGFSLLMAIKANESIKQTPILLVTEVTTTIIDCPELLPTKSSYDYVTRPLTALKLKEKIQGLINRQST